MLKVAPTQLGRGGSCSAFAFLMLYLATISIHCKSGSLILKKCSRPTCLNACVFRGSSCETWGDPAKLPYTALSIFNLPPKGADAVPSDGL